MTLVPSALPARVPFALQARVSRDKVKLYMLCADHEDGGSDKARMWHSALGYDQSHCARLQDELRACAASAEVLGCRLMPDGWMLWSTRAELVGPNGRGYPVRINWVTIAPGTSPKLTSAWPDTKAEKARAAGGEGGAPPA